MCPSAERFRSSAGNLNLRATPYGDAVLGAVRTVQGVYDD